MKVSLAEPSASTVVVDPAQVFCGDTIFNSMSEQGTFARGPAKEAVETGTARDELVTSGLMMPLQVQEKVDNNSFVD